MAPAQRRWQVDWAGPHGTAWGTVNAVLTTVTAAWVAHLTEGWWPAPVTVVALTVVGVTILGVVGVLLRAAFAPKRRPGATVIYQVCCWVGAGCWIVVMVTEPHWSARWFLARLAALAVAAVVAGLLAGLAAPDPDPDAPTPTSEPARTAGGDPALAARNALAVEWEDRLDRRCDGDGYKVPNIEVWPRDNGYTVQADAPLGSSWRSIASQADALAADLNLPYGGGIVVTMGTTRRTALIEVTTVDVLAEEYPYPDDRRVHSINDALTVGMRDDGNPIGPNLRQNCMVIAGEAGSGKTNAGHCVTAEIVTTDDALPWFWDLTGKAFAAWIGPYLRGEVDTPALDWCARDGQELLFMTRAALRIGLVRPHAYAQAMLDADDDNVPVTPNRPEVVVLGDEIARVTGVMTEHEAAKENLRLVVFEHRAAAVRAVFFALRGTDDVISSSIQSQCQVRGVMKIGTKAEASWVLGNHGFGPEDTPYPGCGGISLSSGELPVRLKYFRLRPRQIREIAMRFASRRPRLDEASRLAANGRNPDGTPMRDLEPGELDCYDTRWDRYRAQYGPAATTSPQPQPSEPTATASNAGTVPSPAQAVADLNRVMAELDAAVAAAKARDAAGQVPASAEPDEQVPVDGDAWAEVMAAWNADDYDGDDAPSVPAGDPPSDWPLRMLGIVGDYGTEGVGPRELLAALAQQGIVVHRDTLNEHLRAAIERGDVHKPHGRGKYVRRWST